MNIKEKGHPSRIDDDGIVDSIVMLQFDSEFNSKKIEEELNIFLNSVYSDDMFKTIPLNAKDFKYSKNKDENRVFYSNGTLKIYIDDNKFMIDFCIDIYPGWQILYDFTKKIIKHYFEIVQFTQVGVRYISVAANETLVENLDGKIEFNNLPAFNRANYNFSYTIHDEKYDSDVFVTIRLSDRENYKKKGPAFFVDIEINNDVSKIKELSQDSIFNRVNLCHHYEKDMYFRLMNENYLEKHNPVW